MQTKRDSADLLPEVAGIAASVPFLSVERCKPGSPSAPRAKGLGLGLSVLVHLLALAAVLQMTAVPAVLEGHEERLSVEIVALPPAPVAEEPAPIPEPPKQPVEVQTPAKPKPILRPQAAVRPAAPSPQPEVSSTAVAMAPSPASEPPVAAAPVKPSIADDSLQKYGQEVWAQILRHKPRGIRFQGVVQLSFSLSARGDLLTSEVARSSGMGSLDQAALTALRDAAPFSPPPEGATAEQLKFTIPFTFQ
jgi:protein TonB